LKGLKLNKCHFLGKVIEPPRLHDENGTSVVRFVLEVEEYRRDKSGEKKRSVNYLDFEAWDSAAIAIERYAFDGCLMAVESIARRYEDIVVFRVTNFKILH
tara:strand:+ start:29117 stop:29419 length:303 start_codon:yes stop_codon:yes gene_type:complete